MSHRIKVESDDLRFSAGHFATFGGDCEPLHGHNYRVSVEVGGGLTPDSWVIDFGDVKRAGASICRELDHKFLLQGESRVLRIEESKGAFTVSFGNRRYVMPEEDVVCLPIDNTTAERLAEWFAGRISTVLTEAGGELESVTVGVEEAPGQSGWYTTRL
jgi:6-pyruvoyltetrahydropterin/6-carboxytetrahydropterin synthase